LAQIIIMSGHFDGVTTAVASELDGLWRLAKPFTKEELDQVLCSEVPEV